MANDYGPRTNMGDGDFDEILTERREEFEQWDDDTVEERMYSMRDRDYYDGRQWTPEQTAKLASRNQPAIVFNRIAPTLNYILGTELESKVDPRAYPRNKQHETDADAATDALRYVVDKDKFDSKDAEVTGEVYIEGLGGIVYSIDAEDIADATEIFADHVPWDRIFWDPTSRKADFSDAMFMGTIVWMSMKEARAMYPDQEDMIDATSMTPTTESESTQSKPRWLNRAKDQIQVIEHYWREWDEETGRFEWWECQYVGGGFLQYPTPVQFRMPPRDNEEIGQSWCPMHVTSGYVSRGTSDTNEHYGAARPMIGPQDEINHRRSKAIHLQHSSRVIYETGSIPDPDEFQTEINKPDGMAEVAAGRLTDKTLEVLPNYELANAQVQMLQDAYASFDRVGPRPMPMQNDNEMSGRLFIAQQEAGALELKPIRDHLSDWRTGAYDRYWWLIRLVWTEEKWIRVTDDNTGYRFVRINEPTTRGERMQNLMQRGTAMPEALEQAFGPNGQQMFGLIQQQLQEKIQQQLGKQHEQQVEQIRLSGQDPSQVPPPQGPPPEQVQAMAMQQLMQSAPAQEAFTANSVAQLDVDIILDSSVNSVILEHEQFREFTGMIQNGMIPASPGVLEMVVEMSSLPNKEKYKKLLAPPPPDPQQVQMQQKQMELTLAQLQATVTKLQADAKKAQADAGLSAAKTELGVPAEAQADQARAGLDAAKTQAVPHEAQLKQAQTHKTSREAAVVSANGVGPQGAG